jgi:hypothetical protein
MRPARAIRTPLTRFVKLMPEHSWLNVWKASASYVQDEDFSPGIEDGHDYTMRPNHMRMDQLRHSSEHHGAHESRL